MTSSFVEVYLGTPLSRSQRQALLTVEWKIKFYWTLFSSTLKLFLQICVLDYLINIPHIMTTNLSGTLPGSGIVEIATNGSAKPFMSVYLAW